MSARAMASATISFGLVSIPVKVYATGESSGSIAFNMLHRTCGSRLRIQYWCPKDDEVVGREDTVKGYEFAKGQYVMFSPEELKALEAQSTQEITITEFLPTDKIDPVYFEKAYYLGPGKGGDRAYKLLAAALGDSGRSALATYAARGKQYLVLLRPVDGGIVMQQLRYADEVRPISEVPLGDADIKPAELKLAMQIIEQGMTETFRPEEYKDDVRDRVMGLVTQKVEGQEITAAPAEEPRAQVIDLMEALKASLNERALERHPPRSTSRAAAKATRSRKTARRAKSS